MYREGSVSRGRLFSVHALPNASDKARLGLSVSKKVGGAVKRNGVRRRLKEIFHSAGPDLPQGVDIVVSARPAAAEATFEELASEFSRALDVLKGRKAAKGAGDKA